MIGSIIGGALGAVGNIFGGIKASQAMKRVKENLNSQKAANRNWYDRRYNEDATQRADAREILTKTEESIRERNRAAAGAQAVMGGTEESVAATKAANASAQAQAVSTIAVNADRRKDAIESQFQSKDEALQSELNNMERGKANAISQAIPGVASAGGNIAELF